MVSSGRRRNSSVRAARSRSTGIERLGAGQQLIVARRLPRAGRSLASGIAILSRMSHAVAVYSPPGGRMREPKSTAARHIEMVGIGFPASGYDSVA